jgi:hypothetical protein
MPRLNEIDRRVLESMTGRAKLDALLEEAGHPTVRAVSFALAEFPDDVSRCLSGHQGRRPTMDRIRAKVADMLGLARETVDELLGGPLADEDTP